MLTSDGHELKLAAVEEMAPGTAVVFDVQRFSIHDGPGIRTTVFMKGCLLKCDWCSNPESQDLDPQLLVREIKCKKSGACIKACPEKAIHFDNDNDRIIDWTKCTQCLKCVDACLYGSLNASGRMMSIKEIITQTLKDQVFYDESGGGLTVSGGEPLLQGGFVADLFAEAKAQGLHTAMDTCGYAPWARFEKVLPYLDLVMFDIKQLDDVEHERTTGLSNRIILENLERLAGLVTIWIRVPLIKGFNDSADHIRNVAKIAKSVGAEQVSLLPYHQGGWSKAKQIGMTYPIENAEEPEQDQIEALAKIIADAGVKAVVGA